MCGDAFKCTNEQIMTQLLRSLPQDSLKLANMPSLLHQTRVLRQRSKRTIAQGLEGLLILFFSDNPYIFEDITVIISQEKRYDLAMYHYPQDHHDHMYSGLDVSYFLSFLSEMKKKDNGKIA